MVTVSDLAGPTAIIPNLKISSKKQALQELSAFAAKKLGRDDREIFDVLLQRERLGTTGLGYGVAIPHGKLSGLEKITGIFARLEKPVDFESLDDQPVDLVFVLLVPEGAGAEHLKALAQVSRLFRNTEVCEKIRGSENADAIYALLSEFEASAEAA